MLAFSLGLVLLGVAAVVGVRRGPLHCRLGSCWMDGFPSPVGMPGWFPVGAVTDTASLTLHVTFCGLVHLLLLGRYLEVQLRGFCVACLTRGNQPDCLLPALVSTSNT